MTMTKRNSKNDNFIFSTIEQLVPQDHMVRKMESCLDWRFIYPLVEDLYSDFGRPSIDPVILFKMIIINIAFGYNSMRRTCREIEVNLAYRWFLGISMDESVPNYSTWSKNYERRYGDSQVFDQIFTVILRTAMDNGFVDLANVFADSTHQKADANKNKCTDAEVEIAKRIYDDELLEEINKERKKAGKKEFSETDKIELAFDEETGKEIEVKKKRHIKESTTDPESGLFHKGEKQKCFAYSHHTVCDANGFVLLTHTTPGSTHDSTAFFDYYPELMEKFGNEIKTISLDAGYKTPAVARAILKSGTIPYMPYTRPKTKKDNFKKKDYVYDQENDCYICPGGEILKYSTTNRSGYREYKSNKSVCSECPLKDRCTKSKNNTKVITQHVWQRYVDKVDELRHTEEWKTIYPKRKETIERTFAQGKERYNLRFTRLRGLKKNQHQATMIFGVGNLMKLAKWKAIKKEYLMEMMKARA